MRVLGIETSCDETAASVLRFTEGGEYEILSEAVSSQITLHEAYGGVVPELASREHLRNLPHMVGTVLTESGTSPDSVDLLCVTCGPGLKGCLLVGTSFAEGFAAAFGIPIAGVNHIEAHLLSPMLTHPDLEFPFLALVVSGGHTEIIAVHAVGNYTCLARTTDDAAGEAFDKAASLLGFPYPGGAALADKADGYVNDLFSLPKVMRESPGFSFSGLKTAISLLVQRNQNAMSDDTIAGKICSAVQDSIVDALLFKLKRAIRDTGIRRVCVAGGVSANNALRREVAKLKDVKSFFPPAKYSTDNAVMIAYAGLRRFQINPKKNEACTVRSRWPVEEMNFR